MCSSERYAGKGSIRQMIAAAFLTLAAVLALADILGPGHDFGAVGSAVVLFLFFRWLGPRGWNRLLTALLWLSAGIAAMAVVQMWWMPRAHGPFNSPNYLGAYAVLMFFLAVAARSTRSPWAIDWAIVGAANLLSLALSQSRGALLALGAGLFVTLYRKAPLVAGGVGLAVASVALWIRSGNEEARIGLWRLGWQIAQQRLALGWGQGFINVGGLNHFYSIPLDVLIWGGIPAVAAGAWLLVAAWRSASDYRPFLAAWFVQGLFLSGIPATWIPFVAGLGVIAGSASHADRESRSPNASSPAAETPRSAPRCLGRGYARIRTRLQSRTSGPDRSSAPVPATSPNTP
jgi:hypothetical protein